MRAFHPLLFERFRDVSVVDSKNFMIGRADCYRQMVSEAPKLDGVDVPSRSSLDTPSGSSTEELHPLVVPIRDAVTVMLLRENAEGRGSSRGLEVLLLRRSMRASFVPGAYVFPGGVIDPQDHATPDALWSNRTPNAQEPNDSPVALAERRVLVATAIRECFEETGLLPGCDSNGMRLSALAQTLIACRRDVHNNVSTLADVLMSHSVTINIGAVKPWSRWVTPLGSPRRYDTRFFIAEAPQAQEAEPDGEELTEARWFRPAEALAQFHEGTLPLILPTVKSLESLRAFATLRDVFGTNPTE
jgi:8-oxo-dGTP pyrophosphatase MutT (NUDIX family)